MAVELMKFDQAQEEAQRKSLADSIRAKGGTTAQMAWPDGFKAAIQAITGAPEDPHTILLLHGDSVEDVSKYKIPLENHGLISTEDHHRVGGKSLFFDGNSYAKINHALINLNKDFTVDWWEYRTGAGQALLYMKNGNYGAIFADGEKNIRVFGGNQGWTWLPANTVANVKLNTWQHIAVVRQGENVRVYLDGKKVNERVPNGTLTMTNDWFLGERNGAGYKGYIQEFRISDIARWASDFVPQETPYDNLQECPPDGNNLIYGTKEAQHG